MNRLIHLTVNCSLSTLHAFNLFPDLFVLFLGLGLCFSEFISRCFDIGSEGFIFVPQLIKFLLESSLGSDTFIF